MGGLLRLERKGYQRQLFLMAVSLFAVAQLGFFEQIQNPSAQVLGACLFVFFIGFNILDTAINPIIRSEALQAISKRKMFFAGPIELKQGGIGIIGRLPIFNNNEFWGFSAVVIRIESLVKASGIEHIQSQQYSFQLSKYNHVTEKEEFFFDNKTEIKDTNFKVVNINDEDWKLYIIDKGKNQLLAEIKQSFTQAKKATTKFNSVVAFFMR